MRSIATLLSVAALTAVSPACSTTRASIETGLAKALISDQEEQQLGLQVREQLKQQGVKYLQDPQVVQYVNSVGARLFPFAEKDRPGVKWEVQVIDDPKTVNAFAVPGGYLYVYSGLLLAADNEAELAGVLAHETGHVVARHSARHMVDAFGLEAVVGMALGQNPNLVEKVGAGLVGQGVLLAHSRSEEQEADEYGVRYASAAGYDPHALASFFEKLKAQEGRTPKALTLLSDHPATPDRINHVNQYIGEHNLGGSEIGAERLAPIKARLQSHVSNR